MNIFIQYNGNRFPRIVSLKGGKKTNFHIDRRILSLNEYDALFLLRSNTRIGTDRWEFTIVQGSGNFKETDSVSYKETEPNSTFPGFESTTKKRKGK